MRMRCASNYSHLDCNIRVKMHLILILKIPGLYIEQKSYDLDLRPNYSVSDPDSGFLINAHNFPRKYRTKVYEVLHGSRR